MQKMDFYRQRTIEWLDDERCAVTIDQTLLPNEVRFIKCKKVDELVTAIKEMKVRGAPAIGVAGAMGVVLSVLSHPSISKRKLLRLIRTDTQKIVEARPTAINLSWAVDSVLRFIEDELPESIAEVKYETKIIEYIKKLADQDVDANKKLSEAGVAVLKNAKSVLTHCK